MKKVTIFDFDYTLADSTPGIVDCIRTAQAAMGLPLSTPDQIRPTIGLAVPDILVALNGEAQRWRAAEFGRRFRARADQVMGQHIRFYDGVPATLAALRRGGSRVAIASTKFRYRIEAALEREGLSGLVDLVVGAEDVAAHKPDPACLVQVLRHLDAAPAAALYVGDSLSDAEAARRAGIGFVAVLTGTTPPAAFAAHAPVAILDHVARLPGWLAAGDANPCGAGPPAGVGCPPALGLAPLPAPRVGRRG